MTPRDLAVLHPRLFHLTSAETLCAMTAHGLLTARGILARCDMSDARRHQLLTCKRPERVEVTDRDGSRFVLGDNSSIDVAKLADVLDDGLSVSDWLAMLNARVFFWTTREQAGRLRNSRRNRKRDLVIMVVDTEALAQRYHDAMQISPINSGATLYRPSRRGRATFAPLAGETYAAWQRARRPNGRDTIKEVVITRSVPDIMEYVIDVA